MSPCLLLFYLSDSRYTIQCVLHTLIAVERRIAVHTVCDLAARRAGRPCTVSVSVLCAALPAGAISFIISFISIS